MNSKSAQLDISQASSVRTQFDLGLLLLRTGIGAMMLVWGLDKLVHFKAYASTFPDPFGLGRGITLGLTVLAQMPCSLFVAAGCFTRIAAIPPMITMLVAAVVIHGLDQWSGVEHALLYAIPFAALALSGPGRFSLDAVVTRTSSDARADTDDSALPSNSHRKP